MNSVLKTPLEKVCTMCGIPLDAQYFDKSRIVSLKDEPGVLELGRTSVLISLDLPPQYCGVLQYFFQFTNKFPADQSRAATPDFEWSIRANGHPLHPYLGLRHIVNPWGSQTGPMQIRLDDSARLEFAVRRIGTKEQDIDQIGVRFIGRQWYNTSYGSSR
jgi:hypothetical protein